MTRPRMSLWALIAMWTAACGEDGSAATAPPTCHDPAVAGAYETSAVDLELEDPQRDGKLEARIVLPSTGDGPYPLIVLSHGTFMEPVTYDDIAQRLASHGFVVLGTRHRDSTQHAAASVVDACEAIPPNEQLARMVEALIGVFEDDHMQRRVTDVRSLIDHAAKLTAPGGRFEGRIDLDRVGALGHSFGALTSLVLAGARIDETSVTTELCADGPQLADALTGNLGRFITCAVLSKTDVEGIDWETLRDPRIDAVIGMAGPVEKLWGPDGAGLASVAVPAMFIYTDTDAAVPIEHAPAAYAALGDGRGLVTIVGGNHNNFGVVDAQVFEAVAETVPSDCQYRQLFTVVASGDEPALSQAEQQRMIQAAVTVFALRHVASVEACDEMLTPEWYEGVAGDLGALEVPGE